MRLWKLALALGCVVGCGRPVTEPARTVVTSPEAAAGHEECPRALTLERGAISEEVVCLLQQYIQIDSTNPPGNELETASFLKRVLERDGISAELVESTPGRANLIARVKGQHPGSALMLMHHMDVVPASAGDWSVPPFAGTLRDGSVWGRGSLDNKGAGIVELVALLLFRRLGVLPEHDLVLLAVADEESGGGWGARWVNEHRKEWFADVEFILNEGGGVLELPGGRMLYMVELAQKAPLWLEVTASGKAGHGGAPSPNSAAAVLVRALGRVQAHEFPIEVLPEVQAVFTARAAAMPEAQRGRFLNLARSLQDRAFKDEFLSDPHDAALVKDTLAITMLSGSAKENVISEHASAVLDVRLLPGRDPEAVTRELTAVMAEPSLSIKTLLSWQAHRTPRDTALFAAIEQLARERHPGASVSANVIGGFTDCNAFRAAGKICYGFLPMRITLDEIGRIHGKDERIGVDALTDAVIDLHALSRGSFR